MPFTVKLKTPLHGIAAESMEKGESGKILVEEFLTDKDGEAFYKTIHQFHLQFLQPIVNSGHQLSYIGNMLVTLKDKTAKVYINELDFDMKVIANRDVKVGETLTLEDYRGILSLSFRDFSIPEDEAIIFFFTDGWKRGIYYNLRPNHPQHPENLVEIEKQLGFCYEKLVYSHIYCYDELFPKAYQIGWFPFLALFGEGQKHLLYLLNRLNENKSTENAEQQLIDFFDQSELGTLINRIEKVPALHKHIRFIKIGLNNYLQGGEDNYISAGSTLFPRIEGVLRDIYDPMKKPKQKDLWQNLDTVMAQLNEIPGVFFPSNFVKYLKTYYFKNFNRQKNDIPLSRHSHGHGESLAEDYNQKSVLLLILMFDQLGRYLMNYQPPNTSTI